MGVSNEYDVSKLKSFEEDEQMPWREHFDVDAAAVRQRSRITWGFETDSIPPTFLIDIKDMGPSVTARQDMESHIPKLLVEAD